MGGTHNIEHWPHLLSCILPESTYLGRVFCMWEKMLILILILYVGCQSFHNHIVGGQLLDLPGEWPWVLVGGVTSVGQEGLHHLT